LLPEACGATRSDPRARAGEGRRQWSTRVNASGSPLALIHRRRLSFAARSSFGFLQVLVCRGSNFAHCVLGKGDSLAELGELGAELGELGAALGMTVP